MMIHQCRFIHPSTILIYINIINIRVWFHLQSYQSINLARSRPSRATILAGVLSVSINTINLSLFQAKYPQVRPMAVLRLTRVLNYIYSLYCTAPVTHRLHALRTLASLPEHETYYLYQLINMKYIIIDVVDSGGARILNLGIPTFTKLIYRLKI